MGRYVSDEGASFKKHLEDVQNGVLRFETAYESLSRMLLMDGSPDGVVKKIVNGAQMYDYTFFRQGKKHIVGLYEVLNSFVAFVLDAAAGGSSKEMALVFVGEPGNGKTYSITYIMNYYRKFLRIPRNRRKTFRFIGFNADGDWSATNAKIGGYGNFTSIRSQTYEDPWVLAMNLLEGADKESEENKKWLVDNLGLSAETVGKAYARYRPLGACSAYIWRDIRFLYDGDPMKMLKHVLIEDVPLEQGLGTVTGKYPAKDKITSSAEDLVGASEMMRGLQIENPENPYRYNLQAGALARVAGGGIHFADEMFKNKKDLIQVYLGVIQDRKIELEGYSWPLDTVVLATSNNQEFHRFQSAKEEAPILDRCRILWVGHNTDVLEQTNLTKYSLGNEIRPVIIGGKPTHVDPNTVTAANHFLVLTRLPHTQHATPVEIMKLASGQTAGNKSIKNLREIIDEMNKNPNPAMRFGAQGFGQRDLGRMFQEQLAMMETQEGACIHALDFFAAAETIINDSVQDQGMREKYTKDLGIARGLYRERIMTEMFNAYMEDKDAAKKDVMHYINMIIGVDAEGLPKDKIWFYKDPLTGERKSVKIDESFIKSVEERLGLKSEEARKDYRTKIRKLYSEKLTNDPTYDFTDERDLVKAVTEVRLKGNVASAASLAGALTDRTNDENRKLFERMLGTMCDHKKGLGYCRTCALKTIEYFATPQDES